MRKMQRPAVIAFISLGVIIAVTISVFPLFPREQKVHEAVNVVILDTHKQSIIHTGFARFDGTATYTWGGELATYSGLLSIDGLPLTIDPAYTLYPIHFINGGFARISYEGTRPGDWPILGTMKYEQRLTQFSIRLDETISSIAENCYVVTAPQGCTYAEAAKQNDLIWSVTEDKETVPPS